jgi:quercetin dioxygenase-like cupin family protein
MTFGNLDASPADSKYMADVIHVPAGGGISKWFAGEVHSIKVTAKETGGALGFIEASVAPGVGPVAHSHVSGGEAFFLLAGELEFLNGDRTFLAGPGDFVYVPPGTRHRFKNIGIHTTRMVFMFTPGGLEEVFLRGGEDPRPGEPAPTWGLEQFVAAGAVAADLGLISEVLPE